MARATSMAGCRPRHHPPAAGHCAARARTRPVADRLACSARGQVAIPHHHRDRRSRDQWPPRGNGVGSDRNPRCWLPAACLRAQQLGELLSLDQPAWATGNARPETPAAAAPGSRRSSRRRRKFRPARAGRSLKASAQSTLSDTAFDLAGRQAAGIQATHHRAHAGAGDRIDRRCACPRARAARPTCARARAPRPTAPGQCGDDRGRCTGRHPAPAANPLPAGGK